MDFNTNLGRSQSFGGNNNSTILVNIIYTNSIKYIISLGADIIIIKKVQRHQLWRLNS